MIAVFLLKSNPQTGVFRTAFLYRSANLFKETACNLGTYRLRPDAARMGFDLKKDFWNA